MKGFSSKRIALTVDVTENQKTECLRGCRCTCNPEIVQAGTVKGLQSKGKIHNKIKTNGPGRQKFQEVGKACVAIFGPAPGFKGRTIVSSGFSTKGTINSASAVPLCGWSMHTDIITKAISLNTSFWTMRIFSTKRTINPASAVPHNGWAMQGDINHGNIITIRTLLCNAWTRRGDIGKSFSSAIFTNSGPNGWLPEAEHFAGQYIVESTMRNCQEYAMQAIVNLSFQC